MINVTLYIHEGTLKRAGIGHISCFLRSSDSPSGNFYSFGKLSKPRWIIKAGSENLADEYAAYEAENSYGKYTKIILPELKSTRTNQEILQKIAKKYDATNYNVLTNNCGDAVRDILCFAGLPADNPIPSLIPTYPSAVAERARQIGIDIIDVIASNEDNIDSKPSNFIREIKDTLFDDENIKKRLLGAYEENKNINKNFFKVLRILADYHYNYPKIPRNDKEKLDHLFIDALTYCKAIAYEPTESMFFKRVWHGIKSPFLSLFFLIAVATIGAIFLSLGVAALPILFILRPFMKKENCPSPLREEPSTENIMPLPPRLPPGIPTKAALLFGVPKGGTTAIVERLDMKTPPDKKPNTRKIEWTKNAKNTTPLRESESKTRQWPRRIVTTWVAEKPEYMTSSTTPTSKDLSGSSITSYEASPMRPHK